MSFTVHHTNINLASRVMEYIQSSGGKVLLGGKGNVQERWIEPTVIDSPKLDSKLMQEEIFGPVLPVIGYANEDEMLRFINNRQKPLALYYYGSNAVTKEVRTKPK